jgi:hypothetical protein
LVIEISVIFNSRVEKMPMKGLFSLVIGDDYFNLKTIFFAICRGLLMW